MVDVSAKEPTARTAVATGVLRTTAEVVELLRRDGLPKGDALAIARIAGIMGAKRTPDLVPLCHPIALSGVVVELEAEGAEVAMRATVRTTDRTGVEMEALTAVAVAGLALHDMVKAVDPAAVMDDVRVERKDGGKTGTWTREARERPRRRAGVPATRRDHRVQPGGGGRLPRPRRPADRRLAAGARLRGAGADGRARRRAGRRGDAGGGGRRRRTSS